MSHPFSLMISVIRPYSPTIRFGKPSFLIYGRMRSLKYGTVLSGAFDAADIKRIALLGRLSPSALSRSSAQRSALSSRASSAPNASSRLLISKPCFLSGSHFSLSRPSEASAERTFSQLFRTSGSSQRRFSRCSAPRSMRSVLLLCPVRPLPHSYRI